MKLNLGRRSGSQTTLPPPDCAAFSAQKESSPAWYLVLCQPLRFTLSYEMQAVTLTFRRHPLVRHEAARVVRINATVASCTNRLSNRTALTAAGADKPSTAAASSAQLPLSQPSTALSTRARRCACSAPACFRTVGWQSRAFSNRNLRRYVSLWESSGGVGSSGSGSTEEELARLDQEEEKVLATLSGVVEPCTGKGVVELGLIQDVFIDGEALLEVGCYSNCDWLRKMCSFFRFRSQVSAHGSTTISAVSPFPCMMLPLLFGDSAYCSPLL